jgi:hypothetical protein
MRMKNSKINSTPLKIISKNCRYGITQEIAKGFFFINSLPMNFNVCYYSQCLGIQFTCRWAANALFKKAASWVGNSFTIPAVVWKGLQKALQIVQPNLFGRLWSPENDIGSKSRFKKEINIANQFCWIAVPTLSFACSRYIRRNSDLGNNKTM